MGTQNTVTLPKKAPVFLPSPSLKEEMQKNRKIKSEIW